MNSNELQIIAEIRSCYREKFGIPRQPGLVERARARIVFQPDFGREEMFRELERFSHIWVQFLFHNCIPEGWRPTVRPPWLGGRQRVGVYASRSPHRPNHLGLSVVRLLAVHNQGDGVSLEIGGGDFLDKTPVVDIKPYVPFCDCIPEALSGYSGISLTPLEVHFSAQAKQFCDQYEQQTGRDLLGLIRQVLAQDPRPASQRQRRKRFGILLWDVNIRWQVEEDGVRVVECSQTGEND